MSIPFAKDGRAMRRAMAVGSWAGAIGLVFLFPSPLHWLVLGASIVAAAATLAWPRLFFWLFPTVLVIGDGYLATGMLVVQASDPFLLAIAGSTLWKACDRTSANASKASDRSWIAVVWLLVCLLGFWIGWQSLPASPWGDQLSVYFSRWNAVRVGRGYVWGGVFLFLLHSSHISKGLVFSAFASGMRFALLVVGLIVVLERYAFEGLLDFTSELRATGPFSSMHIGGQHLDAFLTLAIPFLFYRFRDRSPWSRVYSLFLALLSIHAALASMSRATLIAVLIVIAGLAFAQLIPQGQSQVNRRWQMAVYALLMLLCVGLASVAAWKGEAIRARFATVVPDWQTRISHWESAIVESADSWARLLFGRGMGSFPTIEAHRQGKSVPPLSWRSSPTDGESRVRLAPGWPIYLQQWIAPSGDDRCLCKLRVRSIDGDAKLTVSLCQQALLKSYDCREHQVAVRGQGDDGWQEFLVPIPSSSPAIGSQTLLSRHELRPTVFSLYHAGGPGTLEIDSVNMECGGASRPWLRNGYFENGTANWYFSCDDHLIWHAKNSFVHLLSEQGLVGVAAFVALLMGWLRSHARAIFLSRESAAILMATSLVATLWVAMFDSLLDTPVLTGLLLAAIAISPE